MPIFIPPGSGNVIQGNLEVTGNSQIDGSETVDKNVLIQGNEVIEGNLTVLGTINGGGGGPGTFSSLTVTGTTALNTSSGTTSIGNSTITGSGSATSIQLPATSGTLALTPASGTYVTTTTLDNATLPASLTTITSSGVITAGSTGTGQVLCGEVGLGNFFGVEYDVFFGTNSPAEVEVRSYGPVTLSGNATGAVRNPCLQVGTSGNNCITVNNILDNGSTGAADFASTVTIGGNARIASGGVATLTLPTGTGTLALTPASGSYVTTTTLDNATLPASVTTLTSSSTTTLNSTTIPASSTLVTTTTLDNNTLPASLTTLMTSGNVTVGGTLQLDNDLLSAGYSTGGIYLDGNGNVRFPSSSGSLSWNVLSSTGSNLFSVTNSSGNIDTIGTVTVGGNAVLTSGGAATLTLPSTTGTLALTPASGSYVTTTTLDNDTLPASLTTLGTSGLATLSSIQSNTSQLQNDGAGGWVITNTSSSGGKTGVFNGYVQSASQYYTNTAVGDTLFRSNSSTNTFRLGTTASVKSGLNIAGYVVTTNFSTLDDGSGNMIVHGTLTVGGTAVLTAGAGTAITLPATSGTLALAPNYIAAYSSTLSTGTFTTWTTQGSRGITVSGTTFSAPAGTYTIALTGSDTVPGVTQATITPSVSGSGLTESLISGTVYNGNATGFTYSVNSNSMFTTTGTASITFTSAGYTTPTCNVIITQLL